MNKDYESNTNQNPYEEPSVMYVGDTNQSANARSLIKAGYAVLVGGAAVLVAVAGGAGLWVYGATWFWCDPYW